MNDILIKFYIAGCNDDDGIPMEVSQSEIYHLTDALVYADKENYMELGCHDAYLRYFNMDGDEVYAHFNEQDKATHFDTKKQWEV